MTIGQIYSMIKKKNEDTGDQNAWVDVEGNTIWVISPVDELIRYHAEGCTFKDMNEEEINEAVQLALSQDWPDVEEPKSLWFPVR